MQKSKTTSYKTTTWAICLVGMLILVSLFCYPIQSSTIVKAENALVQAQNNPFLITNRSFIELLPLLTLNSAGASQTSFARGTQIKFISELVIYNASFFSDFALWRITLQQPDQSVSSIVSTIVYITIYSGQLFSYDQLIPVDVPTGLWTASIQVFRSDGVTPLAVAVLNFTVT